MLGAAIEVLGRNEVERTCIAKGRYRSFALRVGDIKIIFYLKSSNNTAAKLDGYVYFSKLQSDSSCVQAEQVTDYTRTASRNCSPNCAKQSFEKALYVRIHSYSETSSSVSCRASTKAC